MVRAREEGTMQPLISMLNGGNTRGETANEYCLSKPQLPDRGVLQRFVDALIPEEGYLILVAGLGADDAIRGAPVCIRSENGPEFIAEAVQNHVSTLDVETRFIKLGGPWENGYVESSGVSSARIS